MKIGITYDLRDDYLARGHSLDETAELDSIETIDAVEAALKNQGFVTERIGNIYELTSALASGCRWDLVFNIAEGLFGSTREAQIPALLDAYRIPYTFSDALVLCVTHDKGMAKRIVSERGVATAPFVIINSLKDIKYCSLPYPVFVKPLSEGSSKGITEASLVESPAALKAVCANLLQQYNQPVLVETYLPGREFTVGILGTGHLARVTGVMEIIFLNKSEPGIYSLLNKEHYLERVEYRLAEDVEAGKAADTALAAYRALGCRDAARVDIRSDAQGIPQFMEVNALAGLHPVRSDLVVLAKLLGSSHEALVNEIISGALSRIGAGLESADLKNSSKSKDSRLAKQQSDAVTA